MLLALVPTVISTTPTALSRFEPDKRRCYQDAEFNLPNLRFEDGYRYSHTNCLYQAVIDKIKENCTCLPSFTGSKDNDPVKVCRGKKLACALEWVNLMGNEHNPDLTRTRSVKKDMLKCFQGHR